jgi:hypothetical protein
MTPPAVRFLSRAVCGGDGAADAATAGSFRAAAVACSTLAANRVPIGERSLRDRIRHLTSWIPI